MMNPRKVGAVAGMAVSRLPRQPRDFSNEDLVSSWMMSLHSSTHSSQMNTVGPAMSFRTSCWLFPQKLQYRVLRESPPDLAAGMSVTHLRLGGPPPCGPAHKTMLNATPGSPQPPYVVRRLTCQDPLV